MDRLCVIGWLRFLLFVAIFVWHGLGSKWVFELPLSGGECPTELFLFVFWYMVAFWAFTAMCLLILIILVISVCCSWMSTKR